MKTKRYYVKDKRAKRGLAGLDRNCGDTLVGE